MRNGKCGRQCTPSHQLNEVAEVPLHGLWREPPHQVQGAVQLVIRVGLETNATQVTGREGEKESRWDTMGGENGARQNSLSVTGKDKELSASFNVRRV